MRTFNIYFAIIGLMMLGACGAVHDDLLHEKAQRIASPAYMVERTINAAPFALTAFERIHGQPGPVNIYIGDDLRNMGRITTNKTTASYPVALHLAAMDKSANVVYLALPCQYTGLIDEGRDCHADKGKNAGPTLEALNTAITDVKAKYRLDDVNLIGYGHGGYFAALLAAARPDVASLRSVSPMLEGHFEIPQSAYGRLATIPQRHFIGALDPDIFVENYKIYKEKLPAARCVSHQLVEGAGHEVGWANRWGELIAMPVGCATAAAPRYDFRKVQDFTTRATPKTRYLPGSDK